MLEITREERCSSRETTQSYVTESIGFQFEPFALMKGDEKLCVCPLNSCK